MTTPPLPVPSHSRTTGHRYLVIDVSGPTVTALPRTTAYPRTAEAEAQAFPHAMHESCEPSCRVDKAGFILRRPYSFDRDAFGGRYSCTEQDARVLRWVFEG